MNFLTIELTVYSLNYMTYSNLANVQSVGIGIYLAMGIVQAVSSGGASGPRRRILNLEETMNNTSLWIKEINIVHLKNELIRLEIGLHSKTMLLLVVNSILLSLCLIFLIYSTINSADTPGIWASGEIIFFYIILPTAILFGFLVTIWLSCQPIYKKIKATEKLVLSNMLKFESLPD